MMINPFKFLFPIVISSLLMLLTGCNSEGGFSPHSPDAAPKEVAEGSALVDIKGNSVNNQAFPVGVPVRLTFSVDFTDGRTYSTDDDTTDLTFMTWAISPEGTGATISGEGDLNTAAVTPWTSLTITATGNSPYDTVTDSIDVVVSTSLAGKSIDIFDTGSGTFFTSSPSVAYLDSIDGSPTDAIYPENGTDGPSGDFYKFTWYNANALCTTYSTHSLGGRANWRLATKDELKEELYGASGNMFMARGWPTFGYYWSATPDGSYYYIVDLSNGNDRNPNPDPSVTMYASCVSNP